jgi:hypothetical protein
MTADNGADTGTIAADSDPRVKSVLAAIRGIPDFPKKVLTGPSNQQSGHMHNAGVQLYDRLLLSMALHGVPHQGHVTRVWHVRRCGILLLMLNAGHILL